MLVLIVDIFLLYIKKKVRECRGLTHEKGLEREVTLT